ncbi:MAG: FixH family protein [Bacteroidia bacterium]|nr:FixH family protein [Bacteroidia bacterium]
MKLNWGTYAALMYLAFVAGMGYLVYRSTQEKIDLVITNYYEHDKLFPEKYEQQQNAIHLKEQVKITSGNPVTIQFYSAFPEKGTVQLYRPDNSFLDKTIDLTVDEKGAMHIESSSLKHGLWKVILQWESEGKKYYTEDRIFI